jgi:hypothetical protein
MLFVSLLFASCTKYTYPISYKQQSSFFERIDSLRKFYNILNGGLANDALLNNTITHFKDFDVKTI